MHHPLQVHINFSTWMDSGASLIRNHSGRFLEPGQGSLSMVERHCCRTASLVIDMHLEVQDT